MTILIKNVFVFDGLGAPPVRQDILVSGRRISAIGSFPRKHADSVVDGQGGYCMPGFIDIHNDSDHYLALLSNPAQSRFLEQGATTLIGGHCGSSLAPLLYGGLESLQKWGGTRVNINWHSVKEFLGALEKQPLDINFGTLVGHATIRRALTGNAIRPLTKNEIMVFGHILERAFAEGALGLSFGLDYVHSRTTPYAELKALLTTVKKAGKVCTVHLRNSADKLLDSIQEVIKLAKETEVPIIISHYVPIHGYEKEYEQGLVLLNTAPTSLYFDTHLAPVSTIELYTLLPEWAQNGGIDVMSANIQDPWLQKRIRKDMQTLNPNECIIAQAPESDFLVGKTLKEFQEAYGTDADGALMQLMLLTKLRGTLLCKNINESLLDKALSHPRALIGSNAADCSGGVLPAVAQTPGASDTFLKFLTRVEQNKLLPLEQAIQKITSRPAAILGISERGVLREGHYADIVTLRGRAIHSVLVNGHEVVADGRYTSNQHAGRVITPS